MKSNEISIFGSQSVVAVDRAITELRHGRAVRVDHSDGAVLAVAVEVASATALRELTSLTALDARLVVTGRRAAALGIASANGEPIALPVDHSADMNDVTHLAMSRLKSKRISTLVDDISSTEVSSAAAAALVLAKLARLLPAVLTVELAGSDMAEATSVAEVLTVHSEDIYNYPKAVVSSPTKVSDAAVPLETHEHCRFVLFRTADGKTEHVAILIGEIDQQRPAAVRLHSACLTGDLFGSLRCDCGDQLRTAVEQIAMAGGGVLLYLAQEGRGIGLANKLRAYRLQDSGLDTLDADQYLGFEPDERDYHIAAEMLKALGIRRIYLLTNNPDKLSALQNAGIETVDRIPLIASVNRHNERYLRAKAERAGHLFNQA